MTLLTPGARRLGPGRVQLPRPAQHGLRLRKPPAGHWGCGVGDPSEAETGHIIIFSSDGYNHAPGEVLSHATALVAPARVHLLRPPGDGAEPGEVSVQHPGVVSALR